MIVLQAKFNGKSSLGFINNEIYYLGLKISDIVSSTNSHSYVEIETNSGSFPNYTKLRCEYSNIRKFLENWKPLKINTIEIISPEISKNWQHTISSIKSSIREQKLEKLLS